MKHRRDHEDRLPDSQWFYAVGRLAFTDFCWMRSSWLSWVIRASGPIRNSPGFYPSILRHSGIWGAADEAVLNSVSKNKKMYRKYLYSVSVIQILYFIFSFLCFFFRVHHLLYTLRRDEIRYEQVLLFMQNSSEFTTAAFIAVVWYRYSPPPCVARKGYLVPAKQRGERQRERRGNDIAVTTVGRDGKDPDRIQTTKNLDIFSFIFSFSLYLKI